MLQAIIPLSAFPSSQHDPSIGACPFLFPNIKEIIKCPSLENDGKFLWAAQILPLDIKQHCWHFLVHTLATGKLGYVYTTEKLGDQILETVLQRNAT